MVNTIKRLIIFFTAEDGKTIFSQQKQIWDLTVGYIMNSSLKNSDLKKVGKTIRPFRYDLNQIPYDYTVEVRNRVPDELWMEVHDIVQETMIKTTAKKRNVKRQNGCLRRPYK